MVWLFTKTSSGPHSALNPGYNSRNSGSIFVLPYLMYLFSLAVLKIFFLYH